MNTAIDTEYIILENIYDSTGLQTPLKQRDLAHIAGASLGMTNLILKRLAQKGWITAKKTNRRNIQYAVTIEGINEIIHHSYRYFKRTIRNVVYFKDILEDLAYRAKRKNIKTVILVGKSDLDFIVEHACRRWDLNLIKTTESEKSYETPPAGTLKIYAEGISETPESQMTGTSTEAFFLSKLIIKQTAGGLYGDGRVDEETLEHPH
ncbi:MAG: transcriptional regulator [Treponema sp.]|jgi:DNA-binding MarR family transcriptional regulator|nr:transcriptional regulator [Treponema sp.]